MKHLYLILNLVLFAAVGVLYYLHFSGNKKCDAPGSILSKFSRDSGCVKTPVIAYVEMDSLNNNVTVIRNRRKELEQEQKGILAEYENAYKGLEEEKNNFLKKGNAITQEEAQQFQEKLTYKQQDVENKKQVKGQQLAEKGAKVMEDMQAKLKEFLNDYNKDKKFTYIFATGSGLDYLFYKDSALNITPDIIKGLNEKMNSPK